MSKIVKSYSLSVSAINEIKKIKDEKDYKSDSEALEAIILKKETDTERIKNIVLEILKESQLDVTINKEKDTISKVEDEVAEALKASMNDIWKTM